MKLTTHADRYKGRNPVSKALSPRTPQVLVVAKGHLKLKILLYTDLRVAKEDLFWHRDLGLLTKAFRELGHDAWLVVHPASESASKIQNQKSKISDDPVIWTSPSAVRSPSWWQSHKPNLVILGLWTRPKYDPIRRAALSATPHVIERADSDGMRTASCGLLTYAKRRYDYFRDRTYRWPAILSIPGSILYSFASILATPWIEARLTQTLKLLPTVTVETPRATALWKKLATKLGADPDRILFVPHPIQTDIFRPDSLILKKKQIISVGRWESYQKNFPLLMKTLLAFLDKNPAWSALVVGSGLPTTSGHSRVTFSPYLNAPELALRMQESAVFLSTSRYESFGLAAIEAFLCGCRIEAPPALNPWAELRQPHTGLNRGDHNHGKETIFFADSPSRPFAVPWNPHPGDFEGCTIASALIARTAASPEPQAFQ